MTPEEIDTLEPAGWGPCKNAAIAAAREDPTLTIVRGYRIYGAHWWVVDETGSVIDPIRGMDPVENPEIYHPEMIGARPDDESTMARCANCGSTGPMGEEAPDGSTRGSTVCSERCGDEFTASFDEGWGCGYDY